MHFCYYVVVMVAAPKKSAWNAIDFAQWLSTYSLTSGQVAG